MKILILKNIASEGPGTIEDYLRESNLAYHIVDLHKGEPMPRLEPFSHLIIMGGPMGVYEMHRHPYLAEEAALIEKAIKANMHVLGICLGAQMLAHVLGGRVYSGFHKEIGWYEVALTEEGMQDRCMRELSVDGKYVAQVFQWHGDTFDLPQDAARLAFSGLYPNQAFRYSDRVYALQFHLEVTPDIVREWLKDEKGVEFARIDAESGRIFTSYLKRAQNFYRMFFTSESSG